MSKQTIARRKKLLEKKGEKFNPVHTKRRDLGSCPNCGYEYKTLHELNRGICDCPRLNAGQGG